MDLPLVITKLNGRWLKWTAVVKLSFFLDFSIHPWYICNMNNNPLIQYVKETRGKRRGQLRGVVIAVKDPQDRYRIGWSFVNRKSGDKFDKEMGLSIALGRTLQTHICKKKIPQDVVPVLSSMKERAERYFKNWYMATVIIVFAIAVIFAVVLHLLVLWFQS